MANQLLVNEEVVMEADDDKINNILDIPFVQDCQTKEDKVSMILAILLQNLHHAKNADRIKAFADETYVDIRNIDQADTYLGTLLTQNLTEKFRKNEKETIGRYKGNHLVILADKILTAPNHIYAAVMMKVEGLHFGKGDFNHILEKLQNVRSTKFVDIGRKLALLKTGILLKKGLQVDIND